MSGHTSCIRGTRLVRMEISVRVERWGRAGRLPGWCRSGGVRLLADPVVGAIASITTAMQECCDDIRATIILALRDDQPGDDPEAAGPPRVYWLPSSMRMPRSC